MTIASLRALSAAVKQNEMPEMALFQESFGNLAANKELETLPALAHMAASGSRDAAKELHDAVLPKRSYSIFPTVVYTHTAVTENASVGQVFDASGRAIDDTGRAWLVAIAEGLADDLEAQALLTLVEVLKSDKNPSLEMLQNAFDASNSSMPNADLHKEAYHAYYGSCDAASDLFESLMPDMKQFDVVTDPTCLRVRVVGWPDGLGGREIRGHGWHEDNEGRAKLMAIVRALLDWHHPEAVTEDEKAKAVIAFQDTRKPASDRKNEAVSANAAEWSEYTKQRPPVGTRFVWISGDHCSSGMAMMTEEGPLDAEDMMNLDENGTDWWRGARWAPLPEGYRLAFEDDRRD
jgi:hypothetical protein